MTRVRTSAIHISALNIVLQPHSPGEYIKLLQKIEGKKYSSLVRGQEAILLGSCHYLNSKNPSEGLSGEIFKFLDLNARDAWFNTKNMDAATPKEVAGMNIPDNMKPLFKRFQYIFIPQGHRFYYVSGKPGQSLSPNLVKNFFENVFAREDFSEFGTLAVTVQPDANRLEELLSLKRMSKLIMEIKKPNPDDLGSFEAKFLARLDRMNAKSEKIEFLQASNEGLHPDDELKTLAAVASVNGFVQAEGKDADGTKQYLSTKDTPLHETVKYNPNLTTEFNTFYDKVVEIHREIVG